MLSIDDPVYWMNNTDPKILDLWIAHLMYEADMANGPRMPAAQALQELAAKWQMQET